MKQLNIWIKLGQIRNLFLVHGRMVKFASKKRVGWSKSGIQIRDRHFIMEILCERENAARGWTYNIGWTRNKTCSFPLPNTSSPRVYPQTNALLPTGQRSGRVDATARIFRLLQEDVCWNGTGGSLDAAPAPLASSSLGTTQLATSTAGPVCYQLRQYSTLLVSVPRKWKYTDDQTNQFETSV